VEWILFCKLCKFGKYICYNSRDIEFFVWEGVVFGVPCTKHHEKVPKNWLLHWLSTSTTVLCMATCHLRTDPPDQFVCCATSSLDIRSRILVASGAHGLVPRATEVCRVSHIRLLWIFTLHVPVFSVADVAGVDVVASVICKTPNTWRKHYHIATISKTISNISSNYRKPSVDGIPYIVRPLNSDFLGLVMGKEKMWCRPNQSPCQM